MGALCVGGNIVLCLRKQIFNRQPQAAAFLRKKMACRRMWSWKSPMWEYREAEGTSGNIKLRPHCLGYQV